MTAAPDDVNAVLLQATEGAGMITVMRPSGNGRESSQDAAGVPEMQSGSGPAISQISPADSDHGAPSAYAIPLDVSPELPTASRYAMEPTLPPEALPGPHDIQREATDPSDARKTAARRQAARTVVNAARASRAAAGKVTQGIGSFIPRLLPVSGQVSWSFLSPAMMFIAVLVPLVVVTVASAVYFRYGRSVQYEQYLVQAKDAKAQALGLADAVAQREAWQRELFYLDRAETHNASAETQALRAEAQQALDKLLGIVRLQFQPVLSSGVGVRIGRLAASDNDLYLLDAERGAVLHLSLTGNGFELDNGFNCAPGSYGDYTVGPLVDILPLPEVNALNAAIVGVDAAGDLLYCAPGQVARGAELAPPDTNWGA